MQRQRTFVMAMGLVLGLLVAARPAGAQSEGDVVGTDRLPPEDAPLPDEDEDLGMDPPSPQGGEAPQAPRPWAEGVPPAQQQAAMDAFRAGNALLKDSLFAQASAKYREALQHWDHPRIHYNLALSLMSLDEPIAIYESLQAALRHGPEGLDEDKHKQAESYLKLYASQIARIEVHCEEPEAEVSVDGKRVFTGPGTYRGLVRIGEHRVVASKAGYLTASKSLVLAPSDEARVRLELIALDKMTESRRRWSQWKPWAVVGGGVAVAAAGGLLHWRSIGNYADYDQGVEEKCAAGCEPGNPEFVALRAIRDRADLQQNAAIGSYALGGTALMTGVVLVYLNRLRVFRLDIPGEEGSAEPAALSLVPLISPDGAGATAAFRF